MSKLYKRTCHNALHNPQLLSEIQRTWAYLESLFIGSEEVKRELPDATTRFARIDADIKGVLRVRHSVQRDSA